jgi:hypothetical protein
LRSPAGIDRRPVGKKGTRPVPGAAPGRTGLVGIPGDLGAATDPLSTKAAIVASSPAGIVQFCVGKATTTSTTPGISLHSRRSWSPDAPDGTARKKRTAPPTAGATPVGASAEVVGGSEQKPRKMLERLKNVDAHELKR